MECSSARRFGFFNIVIAKKMQNGLNLSGGLNIYWLLEFLLFRLLIVVLVTYEICLFLIYVSIITVYGC